MCLAELLELAADGCGLGNDGSRARRTDDRGAQHSGGRVESVEKCERNGGSFPSRDLRLPMGGGDDGGDGTRRRSSLQRGRLGKKPKVIRLVAQTTPGTAPNKRRCEHHLHCGRKLGDFEASRARTKPRSW